jgi:hypothetical protein
MDGILSLERIIYPLDREQRGREDREICMNGYALSKDMNEGMKQEGRRTRKEEDRRIG